MMHRFWKKYGWLAATILGSAVFALGFSCFLLPNEISTGGISGLALVAVELLKFGSVGSLSILINLPLFLFAGLKIGKRFFLGSLVGMLTSSALIDVFALIPMPATEPLVGALYGGVLCGLGLGAVFAAGASTGGSDIVVRLLKLRYRDVPIGTISMCFDGMVAVITGIVFQDLNKALYTGVTVFLCGQVMDAVVYRFDYSKVALIITRQHQAVAEAIDHRLNRGATFLRGEGSYTHQETMVVLTAVKRQQITELKELVMEIDPAAFVIVQEAHQVLGDGFSRYHRNAL
ncbi:MAG: YitT family protein [Candidatus Faecousia sp.]|nr:YitT family protein [Candidatus Faecousia sp.]